MAYRHFLSRFAPAASLLAFIIAACTLVGNENTNQKFSFNKSYDTLAQFDSVVITLRDTTGKTIDVLYRGKADTVKEIENLPAPHWNGSGIVLVSVVGFDSGMVVYHVDKKYNGANSQVLDTIRIILPKTLLAAVAMDLSLTEGDSVPFPKISVTPLELSDKSLTYASSAPTILFVGDGYLRALKRGSAILTVSLNSNPSKTLAIAVTILANPLTPDALTLAPDTLRLAAGGAVGNLAVQVSPSSADASVSWRMLDSTIARFSADGVVQGLKAGQTIAIASSLRRLSLSDSSLIVVQSPVAVASVRFQKDSLDLFVGGAAESLMVAVLPALANPKVDFSVVNPALVSLAGGRVQGLAEGKTLVIAKSAENPSLADTLAVAVFPTQKIDSVIVPLDSIRLFTGGAAATLTGNVYPATSNQSLLWRIRNEAIASLVAAGSVSARAPGRTFAIGYSRVDSTKRDSVLLVVKRDVPLLSVGRDTVLAIGSTIVIRPVVSQEYGSIVKFSWDGNGDGTFEGVSDTLKPVPLTFTEAKEVIAGFAVKDSEGNDTTVYKKVKAVAGPAVQILSPLDSTYTRLFSIDVVWSVNGKEQDSLKKEILKLGANPITRSAKDEAGNPYSATVTVIVDTTPPNKPVVRGQATTTSKTPTWTWATGGGGGNGTFKYWLDVDDSSKGKVTTDTAFTPGTEQAEGIHTLFVAERDRAGNWSLAGRFATRIDLSAPGMPKVSTIPTGPTNVRKPKWVWSSGGNGVGAYQYKLDNGNLSTGATATTDTAYTPLANLANGSHTLYVQERDSAGNWSVSGSAAITIDTIAPGAPVVSALQTSPTNESRPTWNWTGGGGGRGFYRYKIGDTVWASGGLQGSVALYRPDVALAEGARTLYVAEQDSAGNWSAAGSFGVTLDLTAPGAPVIDSTPYSVINSLRPTLTWKSGGGGQAGTPGYRYKLDDANLAFGSTPLSSASLTPGSDLAEGPHSLYVQEMDAAGNWSNSGSRKIIVASAGTVGSPGISDGEAYYATIAFNRDKAPCIGYSDHSGSAPTYSGGTVKCYSSSSGWQSLGNRSATSEVVNQASLEFNSAGAGFLGFRSQNDEAKLARLQYGGSAWEALPRIDSGIGYASPQIVFNSSGEALVAYDKYQSDTDRRRFINLKRFTGTGWSQSGYFFPGAEGAEAFALATNASGVPYIAYSEATTGKINLEYQVATAWSPVSLPSISGILIGFKIGASGAMVLAYSTSSAIKVIRNQAGTWTSLADIPYDGSTQSAYALDLGPNEIPHVLFKDTPVSGGGSPYLAVRSFTGNSWRRLKKSDFTLTSIMSADLALSPEGVPYVAFTEMFADIKISVFRTAIDP